ncbi:hypothetical protein [Streptomyces olivaceus]|uniref:hypothetical protein n=1 Tax=Streptomyces olivaceus TaxID=47716 RepID=UPI004057BC4B
MPSPSEDPVAGAQQAAQTWQPWSSNVTAQPVAGETSHIEQRQQRDEVLEARQALQAHWDRHVGSVPASVLALHHQGAETAVAAASRTQGGLKHAQAGAEPGPGR